MKLQYPRDWDAVDDKSNGETHIQYIDDKGVNRTLSAPTWLFGAIAPAYTMALCKGNDDSPAAWCDGCMEDAKEELRLQELVNRRDLDMALSALRMVLQRKLILEPNDRLYKQHEIVELFHAALEEVESHDLFEK